jgi:hypothetical protein
LTLVPFGAIMVSVHHHLDQWFSQLLPTCKPANWYGSAMVPRFTQHQQQHGQHWGAPVAFDLLQLTQFTTTDRCPNPPTTLLLSSPIWNPATAQFLTLMPESVPNCFTFPISLLPTILAWKVTELTLESLMSGH